MRTISSTYNLDDGSVVTVETDGYMIEMSFQRTDDAGRLLGHPTLVALTSDEVDKITRSMYEAKFMVRDRQRNGQEQQRTKDQSEPNEVRAVRG